MSSYSLVAPVPPTNGEQAIQSLFQDLENLKQVLNPAENSEVPLEIILLYVQSVAIYFYALYFFRSGDENTTMYLAQIANERLGQIYSYLGFAF